MPDSVFDADVKSVVPTEILILSGASVFAGDLSFVRFPSAIVEIATFVPAGRDAEAGIVNFGEEVLKLALSKFSELSTPIVTEPSETVGCNAVAANAVVARPRPSASTIRRVAPRVVFFIVSFIVFFSLVVVEDFPSFQVNIIAKIIDTAIPIADQIIGILSRLF